MIKIFIDPGHGGKDPGASANGLKEKDLTLVIATKIAKQLTTYNNVTTKLSRNRDKTLSLNSRTKMVNDWQADYLLSIHINAGGGTGYEDYIYNGSIKSNTQKLRDIIHTEIVKQLPRVRNRGKKTANFHMLRESKMPAMLSENLFIDTKADATLLATDNFLEKIAQGHTNGIVKAFQLTKSKTSKTTKQTTNINKNTFYRVIAGSYNDKNNADIQVANLRKLGVKGVFIDIFEK